MLGKDGLRLQEGASCNVTRARGIIEDVPLEGIWTMEHWRRRKSGTLYLMDKFAFKNVITNLGKETMFKTMFNAQTPVVAANFCCGLINATGFSTPGAGDTMTSHPNWTEYTNYTVSGNSTIRAAWGQNPAVGPSISNSTPMQFDITAPGGTVQGLFLTTENTKSGTAGILWSAQSYTASVPVVAGDQIRSTYSLSC